MGPGGGLGEVSGVGARGAKGRLKPASGPSLQFSVTALEEDRLFTNTGKLPGARLEFEHVVEPASCGSDVCVTIRISGPLAWLFGRPLKNSMAGAARSSVTGLITHLGQPSK